MIKTEPTIRASIISWNNRFPLDRWWRAKYKVAYGSEIHRGTSQINIYLEWREETIYEQHKKDSKMQKDKAAQYKKGIWIEPYVSEEDEDKLFNMLDVKSLKDQYNG